jgi:hypothetical protein
MLELYEDLLVLHAATRQDPRLRQGARDTAKAVDAEFEKAKGQALLATLSAMKVADLKWLMDESDTTAEPRRGNNIIKAQANG